MLGKIDRLQIAVSYYCNMSCEHCYVPELNRKEYASTLLDRELPLESIHEYIDHLIEHYDLKRISVTGGEAMLNKVWPRTRSVVVHGLKRGLFVQLNTSGSGQVRISELAEAVEGLPGDLLLHISLDGIDEERVNRFRGHSRAMQWALRTMRDVLEYGMRLQVRYTATAENLAEVVPTYELVKELGAEEFVVKPMFAAGVARDHSGDLIDDIRTVADMQRELLTRAVGATTKLVLPQPVYVPRDEFPPDANVRTIDCECGEASLYLSTDGELYPCSYIVGAADAPEWVLGNIADPSFDFDQAFATDDVWDEFRHAEKSGNCTAQNVVARGLPGEITTPNEQWVALNT